MAPSLALHISTAPHCPINCTRSLEMSSTSNCTGIAAATHLSHNCAPHASRLQWHNPATKKMPAADLAHSTHIVRTSPSAQCEAPKGPARPTNMGQRTPGCRPHLISRSWPVCKRRMKSTLGRRPGCVSRLADIQLTVIYSAVCCRCRRFVQARRPAGRLATAATCRAPRQDTVSQMGQQAGLLALMHNNAARCSRGTYSSA